MSRVSDAAGGLAAAAEREGKRQVGSRLPLR